MSSENRAASDGPGIETDEDTTLNAEAMGGRPEYHHRRRRRRRLSQQVQRRFARSNLTRIVLSIVLGMAVVAVSTFLARKSMDLEITVVRTKQ